jgi:hypothetical protein
MRPFASAADFYSVVSHIVDVADFHDVLQGAQKCTALEIERDGDVLVVRSRRLDACLRLKGAAEVKRALHDFERRFMEGRPDYWLAMRRIAATDQ